VAESAWVLVLAVAGAGAVLASVALVKLWQC
jgi:hypothetical protein